MTESQSKTKTIECRSPRSGLTKGIRSAQKSAREHVDKARTILNYYVADHMVRREGKEKWVENGAKKTILRIYDAVAEPIRTKHWKAPRFGNDRTVYMVGLYGSGRTYVQELMTQNLGRRSKYIRHRPHFHIGPTSMIYIIHATIKHAARCQRLPEVTDRILQAVESGTADLMFVYRHPLDSLLTNWVWWRTFIREKRMITSISEIYGSTKDFCAALEENFTEFAAFAEGRADFYASMPPGPRFLSFSEFVEETEIFLRAASVSLRFENFMVDPIQEFSKIADAMSLDIDASRLELAAPKAKSFGYLFIREQVPRFKDFIDGIDPETKRRIVQMGYGLTA